MSNFIRPTVGRVVWYHDQSKAEMRAAIIAHVWGDRMVNLMVISSNGHTYSRTSVVLLQGNDDGVPNSEYCEWMPYQKGQAEKVDELTKTIPTTLVAPAKSLADQLITLDVAGAEEWREYDFIDEHGTGRVYRVEKPAKIQFRHMGSTMRVTDSEGIVHIVPAIGRLGCVVRFKGEVVV